MWWWRCHLRTPLTYCRHACSLNDPFFFVRRETLEGWRHSLILKIRDSGDNEMMLGRKEKRVFNYHVTY